MCRAARCGAIASPEGVPTAEHADQPSGATEDSWTSMHRRGELVGPPRTFVVASVARGGRARSEQPSSTRRVPVRGCCCGRPASACPAGRLALASSPARAEGGRVHDELSIQERLYPDVTCFGCGHENPAGLRLRSYPAANGVTATFDPWPDNNGPGYLNGGIIAIVLDCHTAAAVVLEAHRRGWATPEGRHSATSPPASTSATCGPRPCTNRSSSSRGSQWLRKRRWPSMFRSSGTASPGPRPWGTGSLASAPT